MDLSTSLFALQNDWVLSRVFQKTSGDERVENLWLEEMNSEGNEMNSLPMAAMLDSSVCGGAALGELAGGYVPFASSSSGIPQPVLENSLRNLGNPILPSCLDSFPAAETFPMELGPIKGDPALAPSLDPFILRMLIENYEQILNQGLGEANGGEMVNVSQEAETSTVAWNTDMEKKVSSGENESGPSNSNGI